MTPRTCGALELESSLKPDHSMAPADLKRDEGMVFYYVFLIIADYIIICVYNMAHPLPGGSPHPLPRGSPHPHSHDQ